jgi:regulator of sigma E protease
MGVGRTFFVYGGFLSLNLAIFNLLPFPGLDGWQLFVTFVEGVFRKKIPEKVKNAVSFIGLALLMILSVFLIVKDTFSLLK